MIRTCFALFNLGPGEFFWIFLIFLILFGASALPKLFRSLGKSVREFKRASEGLSDEMEKAAQDQERAAQDKERAAQDKERGAEDQESKKKAGERAASEPPTKADE
jgi:sec-independent protein translocase protein TatA